VASPHGERERERDRFIDNQKMTARERERERERENLEQYFITLHNGGYRASLAWCCQSKTSVHIPAGRTRNLAKTTIVF
jgi:hypothetical protein